MKNNINLIYNRSELGAGTRGSSIGIDALLMEATKKGNTFFRDTPSQSINDKNHILTEPNNHKWAKHIDGLIGIYEEVCETVCDVVKKNNFPLIISGDHASAGGSVAGIKKAHPDKRLGIIWIDAHADLHSPYTSPSGNVHGMPIATIIDEDNLKFELDDVDDSTKIHWEKLKNVGGIKPKALPQDIVFIGVRDTEKEEDYLIEKFKIMNYTPEILRKKTVDKVISEIQEGILADCDIIYVSFDVDSLDSEAVSTGTGTPVENGLMVDEAKQLLGAFMKWDKVVGLEVTEINPLLDNKGNLMAQTALEILEFALDG
jgi:arginase